MSSYMQADHPQAFLGMEIKPEPKYVDSPVLCPVCRGYGGWHLKLDAYGKGKHFNCSCFQCNGWGWVDGNSANATCVHEFKSATIGKCLHKWTCIKCGHSRIIDSSD